MSAIAPALLGWYDDHARTLPWRTPPGSKKRPDPYRIWLSEIMLQQTTVATVGPRYHAFLEKWPTVSHMAKAPLDEILAQWAGLGYYARARNLHKCAIVVAEKFGGAFPETEEELKQLPGVGDYTAAAIAAIAFDRRAVVVDGNIERVIARLFRIERPLPGAKADIKERAGGLWPRRRSGDFAQAMMDLGASICRPRNPACLLCPITDHCAALAAGRQEGLPVKAAKKPKPTRAGSVFVLRNSKGEALFERRPEKGLLGGMLGLPGSEWRATPADPPEDPLIGAPARAQWRKTGEARHTFTHFHLALDVFAATAPKGFRRAPDQRWIDPGEAKLPTVMRKALDAGLADSDT